MSQKNLFVELYRMLEQPAFDSVYETFSGSLLLSKNEYEFIKRFEEFFSEDIELCKVEGKITEISNLSHEHFGKKVELHCLLPDSIFFHDVDDMFQKKDTVGQGNIGFFYLVNDDYMAGEGNEPEKIKQLYLIKEIIDFLSKVLPHSDIGPSLVTFVYFPEDKNGNAKSKRIFKSRFNKEDLLANLDSFVTLRANVCKDDCHEPERIAVFRNSINQLFDSEIARREHFSYLLNNFEELYQIYKDNYQTYINGFSLEKIKKEISEYHDQFSKSINDGMHEIISKSLAIPASIAAGALLMRIGGVTGDVFMISVLTITALITSMLLSWQKISISDIEAHVEKVFSSFHDSPEPTIKYSEEMKRSLKSKARGVRRRVLWMHFISWIPPLVAAFYLIIKYPVRETLQLGFISLGQIVNEELLNISLAVKNLW